MSDKGGATWVDSWHIRIRGTSGAVIRVLHGKRPSRCTNSTKLSIVVECFSSESPLGHREWGEVKDETFFRRNSTVIWTYVLDVYVQLRYELGQELLTPATQNQLMPILVPVPAQKKYRYTVGYLHRLWTYLHLSETRNTNKSLSATYPQNHNYHHMWLTAMTQPSTNYGHFPPQLTYENLRIRFIGIQLIL